jgi:phosphoserine phosphatase
LKRLIAFDVDSTLLRVESLDSALEAVLAGQADAAAARDELSAITQAGMSGRMALRDSLEARLKLAQLDRDGVSAIAESLRQRITPGMRPLLKRLREGGDDVHAISGGFADLLAPVLGDLGFTASQIHANRFVYEGESVVGLDPDCPLSRNGGKAEILQVIGTHADMVIMIGDGMTDFEAFEAGASDRFIGFGAIAAREVVIAAAEWGGADYVRTVDALATALRP